MDEVKSLQKRVNSFFTSINSVNKDLKPQKNSFSSIEWKDLNKGLFEESNLPEKAQPDILRKYRLVWKKITSSSATNRDTKDKYQVIFERLVGNVKYDERLLMMGSALLSSAVPEGVDNNE